jgi:hypothetical protein
VAHIPYGLDRGTLGIAYWRIIEPNFSARVAFSFMVLVFYVRQVFLIWKFGERIFLRGFF